MNVSSAKGIFRDRLIQRKSFWIEKLKTPVPLGLNIVKLINILNYTKDLITALTRFLRSSKEKILTMPYLELLSTQTRTILRKAFKDDLNLL